MKTNVSIKFNSIEEYREIEKKLIDLGYKSKSKPNIKKLELSLIIFESTRNIYININSSKKFDVCFVKGKMKGIIYNSLQEFLNDNAETH